MEIPPIVFSKAKSHFFLWVKKECPFCVTACDALKDLDHPHTIYEVGGDDSAFEELKEMFNWKTVPIIIEQSPTGERNFIGGCSDLLKRFGK
mgnify:CR=1 FL=1